MDSSFATRQFSGALLIQSACSVAGVASAVFYSGYYAIFLGVFVLALAFGTKLPVSKRDRKITISLASLSIALGAGAVVLGIVARVLLQGTQGS